MNQATRNIPRDHTNYIATSVLWVFSSFIYHGSEPVTSPLPLVFLNRNLLLRTPQALVSNFQVYFSFFFFFLRGQVLTPCNQCQSQKRNKEAFKKSHDSSVLCMGLLGFALNSDLTCCERSRYSGSFFQGAVGTTAQEEQQRMCLSCFSNDFNLNTSKFLEFSCGIG